MAQLRRAHTPMTRATATFLGVAVAAALALWGVHPTSAGTVEDTRILASELLIAQGDLQRLDAPDLPERHRAGLRDRLAGSLGLLPWLLRKAGDAPGAEALRAWQGRELKNAQSRQLLGKLLGELTDRHPLDIAAFETAPTPATALREARLIHLTYCAGCHDDMGNGDPDTDLPARDLFLMAADEPRDIFLARLINGVKGDETLGFANPLSDAQIAALWRLYAAPQADARHDDD